MIHAHPWAREGKPMRRTPWRAVSFVLILGLALMSCNGPSRGTLTQPSAASGFRLVVTASPNTIPADGGTSTIQVKVYDTQGQLVDGAFVTVTASPASDDANTTSGFTNKGLFTTSFHSKTGSTKPGTTIITASVEDAYATTLITLF